MFKNCYTITITKMSNKESIDSYVLWCNSSATKLEIGHLHGALRDARICHRLRPECSIGCCRLAAALLALGLYEDAVVVATKGCKLDNNNIELKNILRDALMRKNN